MSVPNTCATVNGPARGGRIRTVQFSYPMDNLTHLHTVDELDAAIAESRQRPVLLFKHSRTCGISCEALDELHSHLNGQPAAASYKLITVQSHRPVSDAA